MTAAYEIGLAAEDDLEGILALQDRNQPDWGGTLSARFSREWFKAAIATMPVVVARYEGRVVGYLVSSPLSANADVPIVQAMLAAYRGARDAYVYGPICVEETKRGRGLAARDVRGPAGAASRPRGRPVHPAGQHRLAQGARAHGHATGRRVHPWRGCLRGPLLYRLTAIRTTLAGAVCGALIARGTVPRMAGTRISGGAASIVSWLHRQALEGSDSGMSWNA